MFSEPERARPESWPMTETPSPPPGWGGAGLKRRKLILHPTKRFWSVRLGGEKQAANINNNGKEEQAKLSFPI
jgi:hypothetical protein